MIENENTVTNFSVHHCFHCHQKSKKNCVTYLTMGIQALKFQSKFGILGEDAQNIKWILAFSSFLISKLLFVFFSTIAD